MFKKCLLFALAVLSLLALLSFFGAVPLDVKELFSGNMESFIFWHIRFPRALAGFLVGAILSLAGLLFQNLFRNDLATPYTLGVSSGAALGAVLAMRLGLGAPLAGLNSVSCGGIVGAIASLGVLFALARLFRTPSTYVLLMCGVAVNLFFSALTLFVQYLLDFSGTFSMLRWLLGSIYVTGYGNVLLLACLLAVLALLVALFKNELLIISAGEQFAAVKGIALAPFRNFILLTVSLVVGSTVAMVGPIGFIGIMVPYMARLAGRSNLPRIAVYCVFFGGILLSLTDFLARIVISPAEIPVGIITTFLGVPFFVTILLSRLKNQ